MIRSSLASECAGLAPAVQALASLFVCIALGGCSGDADDGDAADAGPGNQGDATADAAGSIRGARYCEILFGYVQGSVVEMEVWGTQGLNSCPAESWEALDAEALRMDYGASVVRMNGPRYWVIDHAQAFSTPSGELRTFGDLEMRQLATLTFALSEISTEPYTEVIVNRDTQFDFWKGSEVYELASPDGAVYVMQAYAQIVDASLTEADLPTLGQRLALPEGWSYSTRVLDAPLEVFTPGEAVVVQDELQNTYSRIPAGS